MKYISVISELCLKALIVVFGLLYFVAILRPYTRLNIYKNPDVIAHFTGASIIQNGDTKNLYDFNTQKEYQSNIVKFDNLMAFLTPPTTAYLYVPLHNLSYKTSFYLVCFVDFILLAGTSILLSKMTLRSRSGFFYVLAILPFFYPIFHCVINFQPGILLTFVTTLSLYFAKNEKPFISGALMGLMFIKPTYFPIILIPGLYILIEKKLDKYWSYVKGAALVLLLFLGINSLLYGGTFLSDYVQHLVRSGDINYGVNAIANYNFYSIFWLLTKNEPIAKVLAVLLALFVLSVVAIFLKKRTISNIWSFVVGLLILFPLLNVHTMPNDLVLWIIPLLLVRLSLLETTILFIPLFELGERHYIFVLLCTFVGLYRIGKGFNINVSIFKPRT